MPVAPALARIWGGYLLRLFYARHHPPPFAARWSDTEPKFRSEIKSRASVFPVALSPLSPFLLSLIFLRVFTHGSLSPPKQ
jgi:hypothetical protein